MLFNSIEFFFFLITIFFLYWFPLKNNLRGQNWLLLIGSYFFYGWWDWRFLFLILFSSVLDFLIAQRLGKEKKETNRRILLWVSLLVNLGLLAYLKYFNFFIESFSEAFTFFGNPIEPDRLNIILPVGISFYTFQTLSYTLDVYRKKIDATRDMLSFLTFVSFFPQLVAGPIERASHLLPQFFKKRDFDYKFAVSGIKIMIWGLFKKMVIADNAAILVNGIFEDYPNQTPFTLVLGMFFFAFQIYGDFSGYSDIAIGTSRLFGFDLMTNFKFPYLSKNIGEFWERWHISLSSWFRDYLYIPLGGNKKGKWFSLFNIMIVFLVSGFWHGANLTFLVWGLFNDLLYIPLYLKKSSKDEEFTRMSISNIFQILLTFSLVCIGWVYFRSATVVDANRYLANIVLGNGSNNLLTSTSKHALITIICLLGIFLMVWIEVYYSKSKKWEVTLSNRFLVLISVLIIFMAAFKNPISFIYFQF